MTKGSSHRQYVDMHTHSTASDGTLSPSELVRYGERKGLYAICLSDHDTVSGIAEALSESQSCNLLVIPSIELSAGYLGADVHLLGIGIDPKHPGFLEQLQMLQESRDHRNRVMIQKMRNCGFPITEELIQSRYPGAQITRAHLARYLVEEGYTATKEDAFARYLKKGCPCYIPREMISPASALQIIRHAGGKAVLAHPNLYRHLDREQLEALIKALTEQGLFGIETIYSTNTPGEEAYTRQLAEKYRLHITGGSDFHGANKPDIDLGVGRGNLRIPRELLLPFLS